MKLKELIEKLEAARVLLGDEAVIYAQQRYDWAADGQQEIDKVTPGPGYIRLEYPCR